MVRRRVYSSGGAIRNEASPSRIFEFSELSTAPLIVDAIYRGGRRGNLGDDPISKLIPNCGNQGGFRAIGGQRFGSCCLLVLSSSGDHPDWPDRLDAELGVFTYYGDNRKPGHSLHETPKGGNRLLADMYSAANHVANRSKIPPILVFTKTGERFDVAFRGLAVPSQSEESGLVAIWRQTQGMRFQNYRAQFDLLDCRELSRSWVVAAASGQLEESRQAAPKVWQDWVLRGTTKSLRAPKTISHRSREQQLPRETDRIELEILASIQTLLEATPHDFEFVAAEAFKLIEPRVFDLEVTRKTADGGRDAVGRIRIGGDEQDSDGIFSEFALEAKLYPPSSGVGVGDTSRLISRLRHRQFGVLVTTSYLSTQAYKEIRADGHPIVIISGLDLARLLKSRGINSALRVRAWIERILALGVRA